MDIGVIAERYAEALYMYASRHGAVEVVYAETEILTGNFKKYPALGRVLSNIMLTDEKKAEVVVKCSGTIVSPHFCRFIDMVVEMRREEYLPYICLAYRKLVRERENKIEAEAVTAVHIDEETKGAIRNMFEKLTGKSALLSYKVDPSIIGGYILRWESKQLDRSVSGAIKHIEKSLIR